MCECRPIIAMAAEALIGHPTAQDINQRHVLGKLPPCPWGAPWALPVGIKNSDHDTCGRYGMMASTGNQVKNNDRAPRNTPRVHPCQAADECVAATALRWHKRTNKKPYARARGRKKTMPARPHRSAGASARPPSLNVQPCLIRPVPAPARGVRSSRMDGGGPAWSSRRPERKTSTHSRTQTR